MQVVLRISNGKSNVRQVRLKTNTTIGRSPDCQLKVASNQISRRHCEIVIREDFVAIKDLGSANGTFVNGRQIPAEVEVPLTPGTRVALGPLQFSVEYELGGVTSANKPVRRPEIPVSERDTDSVAQDESTFRAPTAAPTVVPVATTDGAARTQVANPTAIPASSAVDPTSHVVAGLAHSVQVMPVPDVHSVVPSPPQFAPPSQWPAQRNDIQPVALGTSGSQRSPGIADNPLFATAPPSDLNSFGMPNGPIPWSPMDPGLIPPVAPSPSVPANSMPFPGMNPADNNRPAEIGNPPFMVNPGETLADGEASILEEQGATFNFGIYAGSGSGIIVEASDGMPINSEAEEQLSQSPAPKTEKKGFLQRFGWGKKSAAPTLDRGPDVAAAPAAASVAAVSVAATAHPVALEPPVEAPFQESLLESDDGAEASEGENETEEDTPPPDASLQNFFSQFE